MPYDYKYVNRGRLNNYYFNLGTDVPPRANSRVYHDGGATIRWLHLDAAAPAAGYLGESETVAHKLHHAKGW